MVTRDRKSYPALGKRRIQPANCSHNGMKLLHWQNCLDCLVYSFAMLYSTPSESEILLSLIYSRKKKKAQRDKERRGNLFIFLITAQFFVLNHGSSSFFPVVFFKTWSVSTKNDILKYLRHPQLNSM